MIGPHSRACGMLIHEHGIFCHSNCPTCGGKPDLKEYYMSESDKPTPPPLNPEFDLPSMDDVRAKAQETLQNPPTITDKQKAIILTVVGTYVLFKIEKRMVKKVVRKALETTPVKIDLVSYMADLDAYDKAQRAAWLAKNPY